MSFGVTACQRHDASAAIQVGMPSSGNWCSAVIDSLGGQRRYTGSGSADGLQGLSTGLRYKAARRPRTLASPDEWQLARARSRSTAAFVLQVSPIRACLVAAHALQKGHAIVAEDAVVVATFENGENTRARAACILANPLADLGVVRAVE